MCWSSYQGALSLARHVYPLTTLHWQAGGDRGSATFTRGAQPTAACRGWRDGYVPTTCFRCDDNICDVQLTCPIYAALPSEQQMLVFQETPQGSRKVTRLECGGAKLCMQIVLATNIAETSITIPGVVYVVDTGVVKQRTFHTKRAIDSLMVTPISKAAANQRAGRAGRERPGQCRRLYDEPSYEALEEHQPPEIKRTNLNSVMLQLKALGVKNPLTFDFIERPATAAIKLALEHLYALGALERNGELSEPLGRSITIPFNPWHHLYTC